MGRDCAVWLERYLSGSVFKNTESVKAEATRQGFTRGQLSTARKELGVATVSDASLHDGKAQNWFWLVPMGGED